VIRALAGQRFGVNSINTEVRGYSTNPDGSEPGDYVKRGVGKVAFIRVARGLYCLVEDAGAVDSRAQGPHPAALLSVPVDAALLHRLQQLAVERSQPLANLVNSALADHVRAADVPPPLVFTVFTQVQSVHVTPFSPQLLHEQDVADDLDALQRGGYRASR
jgi:hypothetical protein